MGLELQEYFRQLHNELASFLTELKIRKLTQISVGYLQISFSVNLDAQWAKPVHF